LPIIPILILHRRASLSLCLSEGQESTSAHTQCAKIQMFLRRYFIIA
jgi:hypothetical protein